MARVCLVTVLCLMFAVSMSNAQLKERAEEYKSGKRNPSVKQSLPDDSKVQARVNPSAVIDSSLYQQWAGSDWAHTQSSVFSYSNDMKEQVSILRKYENDEWVPVTRSTNKYNDNKSLTQTTVEVYSEGSWNFVEQKFITYTGELVTEEIVQVYNNGAWENQRRVTSKYNNDGNETELLVQIWAGEWVNDQRYTTVYNGEDVTSDLAESWSGTEWSNVFKNEYTYDTQNKIQTSVYSEWSSVGWTFVDKYTDTFNDNNENTETLYQEWNGTEWENIDLSKYTYENQQMKESVAQEWDIDANDWVNASKTIYSYENGKVSEFLYQEWDGETWSNAFRNSIIDNELEYINLTQLWDGTEWMNWSRIIYIYRMTTSVNDSERPASYKLEQNFPNPFNPSTTINFSLSDAQHVSLKIYNVLGQVVSTLVNEEVSAGSHSVKFNAAGLSSGIYYYRIETAGISETRGMMLLK